MKRSWLTLLLLIIMAGLWGQTATEANRLFESGDYYSAQNIYETLLKRKPKDALYNYRYARCAYELGDQETAIKHFEKSGSKYPLANFYLGNIYFDYYRFEEAVQAWQHYIASRPENDQEILELSERLEKAKIAANAIQRVKDVIFIDSIIVNKKDFLSHIPLPPEIGELTQTRLQQIEETNADIIRQVTQRGDRVLESKFTDGSTHLTTAFKLLDTWTEPVQIDDLRTEANENYPFLMLDGITLYFASDSKESMGGYDIFITRLNTANNTYLTPDNIGMPFNSPFNDYMYIVDEVNNIGWFASDRYQPKGKVTIYKFIPNKETKIVHTQDMDSLIALAKITHYTKIVPKSVEPQAKITATDSKTKIIINESIIYSDESEFINNAAQDYYYQMIKLMEEQQSVDKELALLRNNYRNSTNEKRRELKSNILQLEARQRELPALIKTRTKQMRNAELGAMLKK